MRDVLHAFAAALVIAVATVCALVQLGDADRAIDRIGARDDGVIQQVGHTSGGRPAGR